MKATAERVRDGWRKPDQLVWHKPVGPASDDFQAIACSSEEGIVLPTGIRDVPVRLDVPGESWCAECLKADVKRKS